MALGTRLWGVTIVGVFCVLVWLISNAQPAIPPDLEPWVEVKELLRQGDVQRARERSDALLGVKRVTAPPPPPAPEPTTLYTVTSIYVEGEEVVVAEGTLVGAGVLSAKWGKGVSSNSCDAAIWGGDEMARHCGTNYKEPQCGELRDVTEVLRSKVKDGGLKLEVKAATLGKTECTKNTKLVVRYLVKEDVACNEEEHCNGNAHYTTVAMPLHPDEGFKCICTCKLGYSGKDCGACAPGFVSYPHCYAKPFHVTSRIRESKPNDKCPKGLVDLTCDVRQYPLAMRQKQTGAQYMGVMACGMVNLPFRCEVPGPTVKIASLCTLVTGEFVGAHLMLLLESIRVFAPDTPFVIGVEKWNPNIKLIEEKLSKMGLKIELLPMGKTPGLPFWFHEKPALIEKVLEKYENTLWLDADTFLTAPLPEMPDPSTGAFTFGIALHDPRAWGGGHIPHIYGYCNTGVVWVARGNNMMKAWKDAMLRFELPRVIPSLYLDQGPMDVALSTTKGTFRLEPHFNLAWWTPDSNIDANGRPNWWHSPKETQERLTLSPEGDRLHLDGSPVYVVHSHFITEEKAYGTLDKPFNTRVYDLILKATSGPLKDFIPKLQKYATHVSHPSSTVVRPRKGTLEFLDHVT
eukprot:Sspe_Gene.58205::Locus_31928_Transcript_1_1_Confidence_1.000_Length_1889::g.58205::m.58205